MKMSRALSIAFLAGLAISNCSFARPDAPNGTSATAAASDMLPQDASLVTGTLDNGLKYVIKKGSIPAGRAMMWVHIHSGSLNETEKQRGIAHYLEHMAFNGSENFKPGTLIPFFQSMGMTFGRDQNAFTNFDQTTYQLSLPNAAAETLGKGMSFFTDVVGRLSLLPSEVESERQIILEERRRGLSGRQRVQEVIMQRMAPGSLYGVRSPIGTEATIKGVQESDFRDYYNKWYCASNATLIVIADTEPEVVIKAIKDNFGTLPKRAKPVPQDVGVKATSESFAIVASDPEVRGESISIGRIEPARPPTTTISQYRADLELQIAESIMNRRLSEKTARGALKCQSANVSASNSMGIMFNAEISARPNKGQWKEALGDIAMELQRGRMFGFTAHEVDEIKKSLVSNAERAVETEGTQTSSTTIARMNGRVASGEPIMDPKENLRIVKSLLAEITPAAVSKRFAADFDPSRVYFTATLPSGDNLPTEAQVLEAGLKALAVTPTEETEADHATTLMSMLPAGGKFTDFTEHAETHVWSGWLNNNINVHYRKMDARKDQVSISIALIGGELLETAENRGITSAAQLAWSRAATQHLSSTDIRELMNGKKVNVRGGGGFGGGRGGGGRRGGGGGGGGSDAITLSITGAPEELETGFQLAYLLLTEPKIEQTAFENYQTNGKEMLSEAMRSPTALGARAAASIIYPENAVRLQPTTAEHMDKLSLTESQKWLEKLIKTSPIEVTIVGDIEKDQIVPLVEKYLGSLSTREKVSPKAFEDLRKVARPAGPRTFSKSVDTPTDQAFVMSGFYGADESNRADVRALAMAARVLSTRMTKEVREEAQLVYSMGATSRAATTYPGFGVFSASAPTDPVKADALVTKISSMYDEFKAKGPTEEEIEVAKKQMANTFDEQLKDPGYWSGRLDQMTFRGRSVDQILSEPGEYQKITAAEVKATFGKYYSRENSIVVVVRPSEKKPAAN